MAMAMKPSMAMTRKLLVQPGDIVKKGQVVALSGNSGRSTGPHVHFEVHKNGRVVDPASYVHRTQPLIINPVCSPNELLVKFLVGSREYTG